MTRLFTLDERLSVCADFVRDGARLADIGTDHAYLPVWLALNGKISHAIAADVRVLPLERGRSNISRHSAENMVETRLSDGLREISSQEADDIVIAGMGGELIAKILEDAPWVKNPDKRLILQPMTKACELRRYLNENGFEILAEKACTHNGKIYSVLCACFCGEVRHLAPEELYIGKLDMTDKRSVAYAEQVLRKLAKKRDGLAHNGEDTSELDAAMAGIELVLGKV